VTNHVLGGFKCVVPDLKVIVACAVVVGLCLLFGGCASMPVIGPFSYMAANSDANKTIRTAPAPSGSDKFWGGVQGILGTAADMTLYCTAVKLANDELNKDDDKENGSQAMPALGDHNVVIMNNGSGSIDYTYSEGM